jgi:hypothetical protein
MTPSLTYLQAFGNSAPSVLKEGPTIRAIAVAGVGSSALGTAALARNFADALNTDVAGIVTGYGLSDVMTEAFGGWFGFGAADRIRYTMERFFERMRSTMSADAASAESDASATLCEILLAGPPKLDCLVAHSKGSLVVAHALQQLSMIRKATRALCLSACASPRSEPWSGCRWRLRR